MEIQNIPLATIEGNKLQLDIDLRAYSKETVNAAAYKFTGVCYIYQVIDKENTDLLHLIFETKENCLMDDSVPKRFCNELIDQQVRFDVNKQFGHIRDLIVEEAFKPVNNT